MAVIVRGVGDTRMLQEDEAKIAALERMVGRQALELEFLEHFPIRLHRCRIRRR
jgi:hypothetical protein